MIRLGVLCADQMFRHKENLEVLRKDFEVHDFRGWRRWGPATLLRNCRSVEVILTGRASPGLPSALAQNFGRLRYVCHMFGTIRHLVPKELIEAGLTVTNWGDNVAGVAEGAMALLLCQLKQIVTLNQISRTGRDQRIHQMFWPTLHGLDVGLDGFGPIGRHMARMLRPFGARIAIYDPHARRVPGSIRRCRSLQELFATCQAVSIHCGLNAVTADSVTRELLELLPQGGIVINTARGRIVDEEALADLVGRGRLLAGIDVIRHESRAGWRNTPLARHRGAVLTMHHIGGGKGFPPGRRPPPRLPDHTLENLRRYRLGRRLKYVITARAYDLKT